MNIRDPFTNNSQSISDESSNQESAIPWLKWLFSLDDGHWTNSFTLWMSLNIADIVITSTCLSHGMSERNPFLRMAMEDFGVGFMIVLKISLALLFGFLVWRRGSLVMKIALNSFMTLVLIANCVIVFLPFWSLALSQ